MIQQMRQRAHLILFFLVYIPCLALAGSDDYGMSLLSVQTISGSSRYMGMSGAMCAVGGDISAAVDNPAGIGLYRRSEISVTTDISADRCNSENVYRSVRVSVPSVSWLFHFGNYSRMRGVLDQSLSFSYGRTLSVDEDWYGAAVPDYSRQPLGWRGTALSRKDNYNLDYAMNINNRIYIGAGLSLRTYNANILSDISDTIFSDYNVSGLGIGLRAGVLYRPLTWLRLGCAIHSPTWATNISRLPMRSVVGMAFQFRTFGLLSFEYDYQHDGTRRLADRHLLKVGAEYVFLKNGFLNAGYSYSFDNARHSASVGLSWRSTHLVAGVAYMFGREGVPYVSHAYPLYNISPTKFTHNIVFTLAFRYGG